MDTNTNAKELTNSGNDFQFNLILCIGIPVICAFAGEWGREQHEKRTQRLYA